MISAERQQLLEAVAMAQERMIRQSRTRYRTYLRTTQPEMSLPWFQATICDVLDRFADGSVKNMMILMPPQHGKSHLATRNFPPFLLGQNPDYNIAIASYEQTFASKFNRAIQRNMDNEVYGRIFPGTKLNYSKIFKTNYDNYTRTNKEFEIVDRKGSLKTVGRGGGLTGNPVDIGIIDDLYKDRAEAKSPAVSQATYEWYIDVFKTRLHNESRQLIMNTRWDEFDVCGRLLDEEPENWVVIRFPAIRTEDVNDYDPRQVGEALWPEKHSLVRLLDVQAKNETTFNSLYQQDPKAASSLLIYPHVITIPFFPNLEQKFWGLDFGFTNDPTALVKIGVEGENAFFDECLYEKGDDLKKHIPQEELRAEEESLKAGKPKTQARAIKAVLLANGYQTGEVVYCEHVPTEIAALRALGIHAIPAIKGAGSLQAGIQKMKEYRLHVTERSINGRKEANNYKWIVFGQVITNEPEDKNNHFWDAGRYGMYTRYFRA